MKTPDDLQREARTQEVQRIERRLRDEFRSIIEQSSANLKSLRHFTPEEIDNMVHQAVVNHTDWLFREYPLG